MKVFERVPTLIINISQLKNRSQVELHIVVVCHLFSFNRRIIRRHLISYPLTESMLYSHLPSSCRDTYHCFEGKSHSHDHSICSDRRWCISLQAISRLTIAKTEQKTGMLKELSSLIGIPTVNPRSDSAPYNTRQGIFMSFQSCKIILFQNMAEAEPTNMGVPGVNRPYAAYGKACINCVRSKTRCAPSTIGGKCERYVVVLLVFLD
jgi:hypothetical protein